MHDVIKAIEAAVAEEATAEDKQKGAEACRAILATLEAEPGQPLAVVPAPAESPAIPPANPFAALAGMDLDRVLDLVIARLRAALPEEERSAAPPQPAMRIQLVPVPKAQ